MQSHTTLVHGFEISWRYAAKDAAIGELLHVTRNTQGGSVTVPCGLVTVYRKPAGAESAACDSVQVNLSDFSHVAPDQRRYTPDALLSPNPDALAKATASALIRDGRIREPWMLEIRSTRHITWIGAGEIFLDD